MTEEEFYQLKPGDRVSHPMTGPVTITWAERYHKWFEKEDGTREGREVTISFETADHRRCKVNDREVAQLVKL